MYSGVNKQKSDAKDVAAVFNEENESIHLRTQLKSKIDISPKMAEDFTSFYKSNLEGQLDGLAKKGTEDIIDQVLQKGRRPSSHSQNSSANPSDNNPPDTPIEEEENQPSAGEEDDQA